MLRRKINGGCLLQRWLSSDYSFGSSCKMHIVRDEGEKLYPSDTLESRLNMDTNSWNEMSGNETLRRGSLVLLVDDSPLSLQLLTRHFRTRGYRILTAINGREALSVLNNEPNVALVVTDMNMPDLNGLDLLKQLRYSRPHLPVIIVSGQDQQELREDLEGYLVHSVVEKPIDPVKLDHEVAAALDKHYYSPKFVTDLTQCIVGVIETQNKALELDVTALPFLRYGPELLGEICVLVALYGLDLDANLILGGPMSWWTRLATGFLGEHASSSTTLYDCAGEFSNKAATKIREFLGQEGIRSRQSPPFVLRSRHVEVLSESTMPILTIPLEAAGMVSPFYIQMHLKALGPGSNKKVTLQAEGDLKFL